MQRSVEDASLVSVLLGQQRLMHEREEKVRQEAKAEQAELRREMRQQMETVRAHRGR
jgi:hypothetical protein